LYENLLFRIGEFDPVEENSIMQFNFRTEDIKQRPQYVSFTTQDSFINSDNDNILYRYNDKRWLKHKDIRMNNTFTFLDNNFLKYPNTDWAKVGDTDLVYHTEGDLDIVFQNDEIKEGNIVCVVQEASGDWSIKKYLSEYPEPVLLDLRY